ncbi:MAG: VOC family protein [Pseudonocardia sp.]|nr:VOC family protein [Pseudonocardia sp.]
MSALEGEFPGPTPQLVVHNADKAIGFYRRAFDADELVRNHSADGRVMHCELLIFGGRMLVVDDFDEDVIDSPVRLGGTSVRLHLYVPDVDRAYLRALDAGATCVSAPAEAFWGERYAIVRDPFGHCWSLATVRDELTVAEQERRADAWSERNAHRW